MDRNPRRSHDFPAPKYVALRKESVDRNKIPPLCETVPGVALRKESVDRNLSALPGKAVTTKSLSARRAWIEICPVCQWRRSVKLSLSARRAWIEINMLSSAGKYSMVALRKESVDRNRKLLHPS